MNQVVAMRIVRVFTAVAVVVAYSISMFWLGGTVERRGLNTSLAGKNYSLLEDNKRFNDEFYVRQAKIGANVEQILDRLKACKP